MFLKSLDRVIARREFRLDGERLVEVLIGLPHRLSQLGDACVCPYQIKGIGDERVRCTVASDGFEAISCAMHMLGVHLAVADEAGRLSWDAGQGKGDLGLPAWPPNTELKRLVRYSPN